MTTAAEQGTADVNAGSDVVAAADQGARVLSVNHVVAVAVALGAAAVTLAFAFGDTHAGAFQVGWLDGLWLVFVLAAVTCTAELVAVRMRHDDDAVEELTLLDGVVLLNTLVLPIRHALIVTLAGILFAYILRRRDPLKTLYNMGVYASASSATAFLVHWIMPSEGAFDLRLVVAMIVATTAFVAVNLGHMVVLLGAIADARPWEVVREDAPLSLLTIIGTVGVTGTVLAMSVTAPVLLPCSVLPAVALRYAYGASAARHDERRRSARVLEYSQVLASGPTREVALAAFLEMARQEFDAAASLVFFDDGSGFEVDGSSPAPRPVAMTSEYQAFVDDPRLRIVDAAELPAGCHSAMTAPVVVEGRSVGTVVLVTADSARLRPRDLAALSSLVASFAVAVQNADHMLRLVEETSKLRAVVEQASDGIVVLGRAGLVEVWSPAMTLLTGVASSDAIGARLSDVITAEDAENRRIDPFLEGERRVTPELPHCTVDAEVIRPDGERRAARFAHAGVFDGGLLVRDVVIVRDLTAESQVQRMKSDFIATVSHELRTPLTPIKGYADMLRKRGDAMSPEKRQRALDVIVDRAEHLGRLVEDLLAASSITADQEPTHSMATDSADLAALVARACDDFPAASTRLHLAPVSGPVPVLCDPTRAVQIATNLISNALKYSSNDGPVYVAIDQVMGRGRLTVTDHGHGIPTDQLDRIFDKFHRVEDPMVMSTGGTGLGLFIARQLANAMRGELTAESTLGVGSRFTLTLPGATQVIGRGMESSSAADPGLSGDNGSG